MVTARTTVLGAALALALAACSEPSRRSEAPSAAVLMRGSELYARNCSLCHGETGRADTVAASFLFPPARDFSRGDFRLASTQNGVPTDEDLVRTLRRGIPGSAMPAWSFLDEEDLWALAAHVRALAAAGIAERLEGVIREDGDEPDVAEVLETAARRTTPGPVVDVGAPATRTDENLERGRTLYRESCASCHGEDGRGFGREPRWNEDGTLNWARDFTRGVMKGGASHTEIAWRIRVGLAGTAMPPTRIEGEDLAALVLYVQSMMPEGSASRLVQVRRTIPVRRVEGRAPWDPEDARWDEADEIELVLAPLAWNDDAVVAARVAALHNGTDLALRVRWQDASADDGSPGEGLFTDGAAIQFSSDEHPPFLAMGGMGSPVTIWHWRPRAPGSRPGVLDLGAAVPHGEIAANGPTPALVLSGVFEDDLEELRARGLETIDQAELEGEPVLARGRRTTEGWEVVLVRALGPRAESDLRFDVGREVSCGLAVWNGAASDGPGRKSVTIWHRLAIER